MACPTTGRQLPFPLSELQRGHHGCPETGLETSAGTPAPSPLASEALTTVQREHRATLLTRPTAHQAARFAAPLEWCCCVAAGKPGPRSVPLGPHICGAGKSHGGCGGPTPAPEPVWQRGSQDHEACLSGPAHAGRGKSRGGCGGPTPAPEPPT